jgi:hypothetical protein
MRCCLVAQTFPFLKWACQLSRTSGCQPHILQTVRRLANIAPFIFATTASVNSWAQTSNASSAGPPFTASDVEFRSAEVTISGTVVLPPRIWAAVVLVQGAGRQERNTGFAKWLGSQGVGSLICRKELILLRSTGANARFWGSSRFDARKPLPAIDSSGSNPAIAFRRCVQVLSSAAISARATKPRRPHHDRENR